MSLKQICNEIGFSDIELIEILHKQINNIPLSVWINFTNEEFRIKMYDLSVEEKNCLNEYLDILLPCTPILIDKKLYL